MKKKENAAGRGKRIGIAAGAVALALLCFAAGWLGSTLSADARGRSLLWAIGTAEREYYRDVDVDALYDSLFDELSLDPYSEYYTRAEYETVLARAEGKGADYGLSLWTGETAIRVYRVTGNSPAERAGIRDGMYVHAFGRSADALETGDRAAFTAFASETDEMTLSCGFERDGSDAALYRVARGEYRISYCEYRDADGGFRPDPENLQNVQNDAGRALALPADTAYLRIDSFYGSAAAEVRACLSAMRARGRKNLVLDLRRNGGGYLSVFREIAGCLMRDAEGSTPLAATAKFRDGRTVVYNATCNDFGVYFGRDAKIRVLADENTASASECLIGALVSAHTVEYGDIYLREENGVARTYGKGIMQSHFTDPAGNVLKLTVAEIFWPDGTSIHGKGVTAEDGAQAIEAPLLPATEDAFLTAFCGLL